MPSHQNAPRPNLLARPLAKEGCKITPNNGMGGAAARNSTLPRQRDYTFLGPCRTPECPGTRDPDCVNLARDGYQPPWYGSTCYAWSCGQCGDQDECLCAIHVDDTAITQHPALDAFDASPTATAAPAICYQCGYFGEPSRCSFGRTNCTAIYCPSCRAGHECVCENEQSMPRI